MIKNTLGVKQTIGTLFVSCSIFFISCRTTDGIQFVKTKFDKKNESKNFSNNNLKELEKINIVESSIKPIKNKDAKQAITIPLENPEVITSTETTPVIFKQNFPVEYDGIILKNEKGLSEKYSNQIHTSKNNSENRGVLGIVSLALALIILSIVIFGFSAPVSIGLGIIVLALICGPLAIVLGIKGLDNDKKLRALSLAGIVTGVLALGLTLCLILLTILFN